MAACRQSDPQVHPADTRIAAYFQGLHHPQHALPPRTGFVATAEDDKVVGYIAGHLTERFGCHGEMQYLFIAPQFRRRGVGMGLLRLMGEWFREHEAKKICVNVNDESPAAIPFYKYSGAKPLSPQRKYWYVWDDIDTVFRRC